MDDIPVETKRQNVVLAALRCFLKQLACVWSRRVNTEKACR